jgi:hypothetical protein
MHTGMLWFDSQKDKPFAQKLQGAVDYYAKKYGRTPDLCLVHPSMLVGNTHLSLINGLEVRPYRPVVPGDIWVGISDKTDVA